MTDLANDLDTPSDAELISLVRGGDAAAYGVLFSRHRDAANRLARQLVRGLDADDLVSEAFAKVLVVLQGGGGPDVSFRAYLLTAVRRLHVDRLRGAKHLHTTDDLTPFDPGVPFTDTAVAGFESGAAAKAFASLPERWQLVLWHLEVEGQKPADIAPLLGMSPNSVSALAYRAREGLRQAFLTMHLSDTSDADCRWVNEHLGAFVRKGLARRDAAKVQTHLDGCRRCTAMHLELTEVNSDLSAIIAPLLLGSAAAGYLASVSGTGGALGVLTLVSRSKEFAAAHTGGVVAGAVAVGVATAAVATLSLTQSPDGSPDVVADPPVGSTTSVPSSAGAGASGTPSPGATRSTTATGRPTPSRSPSVTPSSSLPTTGAPSATGLPTTGPVRPSGGALARTTPPAGPTGGSGIRPGAGPTGPPPDAGPTGGNGSPTATPTTPSPGTPGGVGLPVLGTPVVRADGTLTVTASALRAGDVLEVTLDSARTTFADAQPAADGCVVAAPRTVRCTTSRATADLEVSLQLEYPGWMVEESLTVTSDVNGAAAPGTVTTTFRPARTPSWDFSVGGLAVTGQRLTGDVDTFALRATLGAAPAGVDELAFRVSGGEVEGRPTGCRVSGDVLTCTDLATSRSVDLEVTSTVDVAHVVGIAVQPPSGYDDPDPANDSSTVTVTPEVDLHLAALTPPDPVPARGSYRVGGVLTGARGGPVAFRVTSGDATLDGSSCGGPAAGDPGRVVCPDPPNGEAVELDLVPGDPSASTPVTVTATAVDQDPLSGGGNATNSAGTLLSPDVDLTSVRVTGHRTDTRRLTVRAQVSGAPSTMRSLRIRVSGGPVTDGSVHFTDGASGADGQDDVNCRTIDESGAPDENDTYVECTGVDTAPDGAFFVDLRLVHPHRTSSPVTFTLLPLHVDQGPRADDDSLGLTLD